MVSCFQVPSNSATTYRHNNAKMDFLHGLLIFEQENARGIVKSECHVCNCHCSITVHETAEQCFANVKAKVRYDCKGMATCRDMDRA